MGTALPWGFDEESDDVSCITDFFLGFYFLIHLTQEFCPFGLVLKVPNKKHPSTPLVDHVIYSFNVCMFALPVIWVIPSVAV